MPNTFAVWNATAPGTTDPVGAPSTAGQFSKQDFLNLLAAQLRQQNPLDPVDNAQFMTQTAQFNMLEQLQELNESLSAAFGLNSLSQASALIGRYVIAASDDGEKVEGIVNEVALSDGKPFLLVDGVAVPADSVAVVKDSADA
jgi:flagellar basal-body rod modification protein FlgD